MDNKQEGGMPTQIVVIQHFLWQEIRIKFKTFHDVWKCKKW